MTSRSRLSSAPSGSSMSSTGGSNTTARARATRCCCPPESCLGYRDSKPWSRTRPSAASTRVRTSAFERLRISRGYATFWNTVRWGNSAYCWNTTPMLRLWAGVSVMSSPPTRISPLVGSSKPAIIRKVVVLPEPLGPSRVRSIPLSILNDRSSTTRVAPNALTSPRTSSVAARIRKPPARPGIPARSCITGGHPHRTRAPTPSSAAIGSRRIYSVRLDLSTARDGRARENTLGWPRVPGGNAGDRRRGRERPTVIRAAIVGLGRWGQNLVECTQGKTDKIRFTAGVARTREKAQAFAGRHGLALIGGYAAALADPGIDAVVLATPHTQHAEQVIAAARAGKHVYTEKPFTLTAASAEAAVKACAEARRVLAVGFNWRYQPALQEIRRMVQDGRLGRLLHIEGNFNGPSVYRFPKEHWRQQPEEGPAGGMTGRGVHLVDAMICLAGRIDSVYAQSSRAVRDFGLDDTTSMLFRFENGATGYLGTVIATAETWRLQVFGASGWAEVGDVEHLNTWQLKVCTIDRENLHLHRRPKVTTFPETSAERAELEHFAQAAMARRPLAVAGGDELHGVAVLEAILESARDGARVGVAKTEIE